MPVKDVVGPQPLSEEDKALIREVQERLGLPGSKRFKRPDDDDLSAAPVPNGPAPKPFSGAATADEPD